MSIKGNNSLMPNNHEGFFSRVGHSIKHWWDGLSPEVKAIVCAGGVMVVNNAVNGFFNNHYRFDFDRSLGKFSMRPSDIDDDDDEDT